jgi:hypothetical protein
MRRHLWMIGLLALPLGACVEYDTANNAHSIAYLVDSRAQVSEARQRAVAECNQINRVPRLSNVTQFQHTLVVFDCRPPDAVGSDIRVLAEPNS